MFWSGWVKDCKGGGLGRGWAGGWWCGYRHRSAKGATSPFGDRSPPNGISIHAPRRERLKSHPRLQEKYGFQSTLPRRERPIPSRYFALSHNTVFRNFQAYIFILTTLITTLFAMLWIFLHFDDLFPNKDSKNCTFVVTTTGLSQFSLASCIG